MRIHVLQHVPFEGPARIGAWAAAAGHCLTSTRLDLGEPLPEIEALDWLLVMGGPMNVDEHERYPWLAAEKAFLGRVVAAGKTVIGVCLGGQLIAAVLGARVSRAAEKEIGWFPLRLTPQARELALFDGLPERFTAFHWHGDTFAIPAGAVHLAESAACPNQAFLYQERVLGLQFHLEATPESIAGLLAHCADELVPGRYVQTAEQMQAGIERRCEEINRILCRILDRLPLPG